MFATLLIAAAICGIEQWGSGSSAFASPGSVPKAGCAGGSGNTLRQNRFLRAFSIEEEEGARRIYVCSKSTGKVWPIAASTAVASPPIRLSGTWAAAATERGRGQDLLVRGVTSRNALSGHLNNCRVGAANRPGQLIIVSSLVVTNDGDIGWSGREKIGARMPVVGACIGDSDQVLARSADVVPHSLALSGDSLEWLNAGVEESFSFG
jgi:hypothetical protein